MLFLFKPDAARRLSIAPRSRGGSSGGMCGSGESAAEARGCARCARRPGLEIEVGEPFNAWTMRAPGRRILGVDFVCRWRSGDVRLSHEHESFVAHLGRSGVQGLGIETRLPEGLRASDRFAALTPWAPFRSTPLGMIHAAALRFRNETPLAKAMDLRVYSKPTVCDGKVATLR